MTTVIMPGATEPEETAGSAPFPPGTVVVPALVVGGKGTVAVTNPTTGTIHQVPVAPPPAVAPAPVVGHPAAPGAGYVGHATALTSQDWITAAQSISCPLINLRALMGVETTGRGFDAYGRPIILYEPHVEYRVVLANAGTPRPGATAGTLQRLQQAGLAYAAQGQQPYPPGQDAQYRRLDQAAAIAGQELAVRACSWGMGQVLGENYAMLGYKSAMAMVQEAMTGEGAQMLQVLRFLRAKRGTAALASGDWLTVASLYNGTKNAEAYAQRLANMAATLTSHAGAPYAPHL